MPDGSFLVIFYVNNSILYLAIQDVAELFDSQ